MTMTNTEAMTPSRRLPLWLWVAAAFGVAWNIFGLVQLTDFVLQTRESLMMKGMSPAAAALYYGLPVWMKLAFALGSFGGVAGSVAMMLRCRAAVPVLGASLVGYIALYAGDYIYGVFEAIPGQRIILSTVVAIAVGLLGVSLLARRQRLLA